MKKETWFCDINDCQHKSSKHRDEKISTIHTNSLGSKRVYTLSMDLCDRCYGGIVERGVMPKTRLDEESNQIIEL